MMPPPIEVLTFTTLFPNSARPSHGIFVANRAEKLAESGAARIEVVAPVPWRPGFVDHPNLGRLDMIPKQTQYRGLAVHHPRYALIPKIGMTLAPLGLYKAGKSVISRLVRHGRRFDLLDAHYFYPDGVAAIALGEHFGLPVVITARGTDINYIPGFPKARRMIQRAAHRAAGLITVCTALKEELVQMGVPPDRITVLRNGVDLDRFKPIDRQTARQALGLRRRTLLSVGLLIERKGHHHVIGALARLPDTDLLIAGQGPDRTALEQLAVRLGVADRVIFLGNLDQDRLCEAYNAADALVLASSREGWANVLLEAMACGTPVVASAVWGTPEVVASPAAGVLVQERSAAAIARAVEELLARPPLRTETRRYAEQFSWNATTRGQLDLFGMLRQKNPVPLAEELQIAFQH
jgi:teichuronic acid biosynthesis glycosyltransferase TuaC